MLGGALEMGFSRLWTPGFSEFPLSNPFHIDVIVAIIMSP